VFPRYQFVGPAAARAVAFHVIHIAVAAGLQPGNRRCSSSASSTPDMPSCWKPSSGPLALIRPRGCEVCGGGHIGYIYASHAALPENLYSAASFTGSLIAPCATRDARILVRRSTRSEPALRRL